MVQRRKTLLVSFLPFTHVLVKMFVWKGPVQNEVCSVHLDNVELRHSKMGELPGGISIRVVGFGGGAFRLLAKCHNLLFRLGPLGLIVHCIGHPSSIPACHLQSSFV